MRKNKAEQEMIAFVLLFLLTPRKIKEYNTRVLRIFKGDFFLDVT